MQFEKIVDRYVDILVKQIEENAEKIDNYDYPEHLFRQIARSGLFTILLPKKCHGSDLNVHEWLKVVKKVSAACASTGIMVAAFNALVAYPLCKFGNEWHKKLLERMSKGEIVGSFALTEEQAGSDAASIKTTIEEVEDGYIVDGKKVFVSGGSIASFILVFAKLKRKGKVTPRFTAVVVPTDLPGVEIIRNEEKMGLHGTVTTQMRFKNVKVPKEAVLLKPGFGFRVAMEALDLGRLGVAAQSVGLAKAALEEAKRYMKERQQFGKNLSEFQGLRWYIADMATWIEAADSLLHKAATAFENGEKQFSKLAAMAKYYCAKIAVDVSRLAVQIFGGYGYIKGYKVERLYRDAKVLEIYEGTAEVQKMVIAGEELR